MCPSQPQLQIHQLPLCSLRFDFLRKSNFLCFHCDGYSCHIIIYVLYIQRYRSSYCLLQGHSYNKKLQIICPAGAFYVHWLFTLLCICGHWMISTFIHSLYPLLCPFCPICVYQVIIYNTYMGYGYNIWDQNYLSAKTHLISPSLVITLLINLPREAKRKYLSPSARKYYFPRNKLIFNRDIKNAVGEEENQTKEKNTQWKQIQVSFLENGFKWVRQLRNCSCWNVWNVEK